MKKQPIDTARVCIDGVLNCPRGEKYGLSHGRRAVEAENIYQETKKRISGKLAAAERHIVVSRIKQTGLYNTLEDAELVLPVVLEAEQRIHVDLLPNPRAVKLLNQGLRQGQREVDGMTDGRCHRMASIRHDLKPGRLPLIPSESEQLVPC